MDPSPDTPTSVVAASAAHLLSPPPSKSSSAGNSALRSHDSSRRFQTLLNGPTPAHVEQGEPADPAAANALTLPPLKFDAAPAPAGGLATPAHVYMQGETESMRSFNSDIDDTEQHYREQQAGLHTRMFETGAVARPSYADGRDATVLMAQVASHEASKYVLPYVPPVNAPQAPPPPQNVPAVGAPKPPGHVSSPSGGPPTYMTPAEYPRGLHRPPPPALHAQHPQHLQHPHSAAQPVQGYPFPYHPPASWSSAAPSSYPPPYHTPMDYARTPYRPYPHDVPGYPQAPPPPPPAGYAHYAGYDTQHALPHVPPAHPYDAMHPMAVIDPHTQRPMLPKYSSAPQKRKRRRYEEIDRIYACNYDGCDRSYGTLNHLNTHVALHGHGEKRTPKEFQEVRRKQRIEKRMRERMEAVSGGGGGGHLPTLSTVPHVPS